MVSMTRRLVHPFSVPAALLCAHLTVVDHSLQIRGPAIVTIIRTMQGTSCIRRGNSNHCDSQKHHHGDYSLCSHHRCLFGLVSSSSWTCCCCLFFSEMLLLALLYQQVFLDVRRCVDNCDACMKEDALIYLFIVAHGSRWGSGRCRPSLSIDCIFPFRDTHLDVEIKV